MINIDYKYIYSLGGLILILIYIVINIYRKDLSKLLIIFSLVSILFVSITEFLFFKDYWYPPDIIDFEFIGIRIILGDILIAISAPSIMSVLYPLVFRLKFNGILNWKVLYSYFIKLFLAHLISVIFYFLITIFLNINSIFSWIMVCTVASSVILFIRRDLLKSYLFTAILSGVGTFIFYYIFQFLIGNDYLYSVWLLDHTKYSIHFLGLDIPSTEVMFSTFAGPFYGLVQPFLLKYEYKKSSDK